LGRKKGCFPQYGKGKATLPSRALIGAENDGMVRENTYFWGVNNE